MERKDNGFKVIAVVALLIAVVGLSIAYAGYTATLTVEGTATVKNAWKIVWTDLDNGAKTGYADLENKSFAINTTTNQSISGFVGTLRAPGDTITYTWKAANQGEVDAVITGITQGEVSCAPATSNGSTAQEATDVCAKLSVKYMYDGKEASTVSNVDLLKGTSKDVSMTLAYAEGDPVELTGDVAVTIGETSFTYEQKATS